MLHRRSLALLLAGLLALGASACSDGNDDDPDVTRDDAITILLSQGYSQAAAECAIDSAADQDVDVLDVFGRDQITMREGQVLASVGEFCLRMHGGSTTTTISAPPSTG